MGARLEPTSDLLRKVEALAPKIAAEAEQTEKTRTMAPDTVRALREAGLFRFMVPKSYGGEELNQLQACRVIEALAKADGVAGWNAMVIFGFNVAFGRFPREVVDQIFSRSADVVARGALAPLGVATAVDGGYIFNGQWPFASGSYDPEWIVASAIVMENGAPKTGPHGGPELRMALMPADAAEILDTWDSVGLRGSASHDFVVKDAFVPKDHTTNVFDMTVPPAYDTPLLRLPFPALTGPTHSAVAIGIAQGALEEVSELCRTKRSAFNPTMRLADDPVFRHRLGECGARIYALRAAMDQTVQQTWDYVQAGETPPLEFLAMSGAVVSYTHVQCVDIVNELFALMGSAPVYNRLTLQRRWRDVRVASQHFGASPAAFGNYGALLAGEAPRPLLK